MQISTVSEFWLGICCAKSLMEARRPIEVSLDKSVVIFSVVIIDMPVKVFQLHIRKYPTNIYLKVIGKTARWLCSGAGLRCG